MTTSITIWKQHFTGVEYAYRNGRTAQVLPPDHVAPGNGWRTRCYKINGAGVITEHESEQDARAAAQTFVLAAPAMSANRRTCHWCGMPLDRHGRCGDCGEQL